MFSVFHTVLHFLSFPRHYFRFSCPYRPPLYLGRQVPFFDTEIPFLLILALLFSFFFPPFFPYLPFPISSVISELLYPDCFHFIPSITFIPFIPFYSLLFPYIPLHSLTFSYISTPFRSLSPCPLLLLLRPPQLPFNASTALRFPTVLPRHKENAPPLFSESATATTSRATMRNRQVSNIP